MTNGNHIKLTKETIQSVEDIHKRLWKACDLIKIMKELDANETFNEGHESIIETIDDSLQVAFDPLSDICTALGVDVDLSVTEELDQDLIDEAKGDDLSPQNDNELAFERGGAIMKDTPMIELHTKLRQAYSTVKMLRCFDMTGDQTGVVELEAPIDVSNMLCVIADQLKEAIAAADKVELSS